MRGTGGMRGCEACGERGLRLDVWLGWRVRCMCVLRVDHGGNQSEIEADNSADGGTGELESATLSAYVNHHDTLDS